MDFFDAFLNPEIIATYLPALIRAAWVTIWISVLVVISGLALGALLAGLRAYQKRWLSLLIVLFADLMRALPPLVLIHVIFPQAMRMNIPPLVNRSLTISKMTAYGSVIGVKEIVSVAGSAQAFSGSATPLTMAALAYLIIFFPAMLLSRYIENRFHYDH